MLLKPVCRLLRHRADSFSSPGSPRIAGNVAWLLLDSIARQGVTFAVLVGMARAYGPVDFGIYNYALAITSLLAIIAGLGLDGIVIREIVHRPGDRDMILGSAFLAKLLAGSILTGIAAGVILLVPVGPQDATLRHTVLAAILSLLFRPLEVIDFYFQSLVRSKYSVMARIVAALSANAVRVALLWASAPIVTFGWTYAIESLILASCLFVAYVNREGSPADWRLSFRPVLAMLQSSFPLILSSLAVVAYMRVDQLIIKQMLGPASVGVYSAALRISEIWYLVPVAVVPSFFPSLLLTRQRDPVLYQRRLQNLYAFLSISSMAVAIPVSLLSPFIIHLVYGPQYREGALVLSLHIWTGALVALGVASSSYLMAEDLTKVSFYRTSLGGVANIVLNILLIPPLGIAGSALATLSAQVVAVFSLAVNRKARSQAPMMLKALFIFPLLYDSFKGRSR